MCYLKVDFKGNVTCKWGKNTKKVLRKRNEWEPAMVAHPGTGEMEAGRSGVKGSLGYITGPYLKNETTITNSWRAIYISNKANFRGKNGYLTTTIISIYKEDLLLNIY